MSQLSASSPLDKSTFKAGWVDVSAGANVNAALKLHESIVHGDFYIWSEGNKLTAEYINSAYVGMNRTAVTHNNDNGVLVPANLAPESTTTIPGTNVPANFGGAKPKQVPNTAPASKHGYYVVYLLECVVRPDIELRDLLACVLKVARTRDCKCVFPHNNHVILKSQTPQQGFINPAHIHPVGENIHGHKLNTVVSASSSSTSTSSTGELREWDQIDVQVVVSQEVKQRMLVCQFLRRVPTLTTSGFGNLNLIIYQIAGGAAPLTLLNSPKTKSFVSKLKVCLLYYTI